MGEIIFHIFGLVTMAAKNKKKQHSNGVHSVANQKSHPEESPLRLFGDAKERINELYQKLDNCVTRAREFYSANQLEDDVLQNVDTASLERLNKSIEIIRGVLSRNQMKVAFFGRTSNGKSTVINAILHDKVLPTGYGHTTGCFLQIQGNQNEEAFLEVHKKGMDVASDHQPIQSVKHIANALNENALEYSTLVKIYWPISKCPLLKYDVVLVDSPGVDVEENLDEWIDEHCHDADVFVLVSNAESTLNIAEKNFFHRVSEKLSKPNIFILNNRWDSIADDPESMEQVKNQHIDRSVSFLSEELKLSTPEEAKQKTFFVSARETLQARTNEIQGGSLREGHEDRSREFNSFESRFEESLSKSAVRTKFLKHSDKGKETINKLTTILNDTKSLVTQVNREKETELRKCEARLKSIVDLFYANEEGLQNQVSEIKKRIQTMADSEFATEIKRLSRVVDDFNLDFSTNLDKLMHYKEELYAHVEESISENLKSRITTVINKHICPFNRTMCDLSLLLSEPRQKQIQRIVAAPNYVQDDLFDLRIYRQFYTDFQEDLEFRFSLGLVSIIRKFQSKINPNRSLSKLPNGSNDQVDPSYTMSANTDVLSVVERFMLNPPQSPTTVGSLAVGGVLVRTVGWKVIVVTVAVYGSLYLYEYLTWTNSAKEKAFRSQYTKYAKKGLQDCVPIISKHIANSIEQKLNTTFLKIKDEIDVESSDLKTRISLFQKSITKLRLCDEFTSELLGESNFLMTELYAFASSFLNI